MDFGLTGRTALVTGSTSGIGQAIAREFSAEGARVAVTYNTSKLAAAKLADELGEASDLALHVRYALSDPSSLVEAVRTVEQRWGGLDVLVANAVQRLPRRDGGTPFDRVEPTSWQPMLHDNLAHTIRTVQLTLAGMRTRRWGRIALISSHVARDGGRGQEVYGAAKAALHGFARSLSWDVSRDGVLVNVISPGLTLTSGVLVNIPAEVCASETARTPTGRLSSPADIAKVVAFYCSAANANITGEVITVAGGR